MVLFFVNNKYGIHNHANVWSSTVSRITLFDIDAFMASDKLNVLRDSHERVYVVWSVGHQAHIFLK